MTVATATLVKVKFRCMFKLFADGPLTQLRDILSTGKCSKDLAEATLEVFQSRHMNVALQLPSTCGFVSLLARKDLTAGDKRFSIYEDFRAVAIPLFTNLEFLDATSVQVDVVQKHWKSILCCMKQMGMFDSASADMLELRLLDQQLVDKVVTPIIDALAPHVEAIFKQVALGYPWFANALGKGKISWPSTMGEDPECGSVQDAIDYGIEFLRSAVGEKLNSNAVLQYQCYAALTATSALGRARGNAKAMNMKATSASNVSKRTAIIYTMMSSHQTVCGESVACTHKKLHDALKTEHSFVDAKVTEFFNKLILNLKTTAEVAGKDAESNVLDLSEQWATAYSSEKDTKVLEVCNSPEASKLKESWQPCATDHKSLLLAVGELNVPAFEWMNEKMAAINTDAGVDDIEALYDQAKDKVCELAMARALARPVKDKKERAALLSKSKGIVKQLEGKLPAQLSFIVDEILKDDETKNNTAAV